MIDEGGEQKKHKTGIDRGMEKSPRRGKRRRSLQGQSTEERRQEEKWLEKGRKKDAKFPKKGRKNRENGRK